MKSIEIKNFHVENMVSPRNHDRKCPNQFVIKIATEKGMKRIFQSYDSVIAVKDETGCITLDESKWNYSRTTGKFRNQFLGEKTAETRRKIKQGIYQLSNLN